MRTCCGFVLGVALLCTPNAALHAGGDFLRGDVNADGIVEPLTEAFLLLEGLFGESETDFVCFDAADVNDDGVITQGDAIYLTNWVFLDGDEPPDPGPFECGPDPDVTDCDESPDPCPLESYDLELSDDFELVVKTGASVAGTGSTFSVRVHVESDEELPVVQFSLCHDEELVSVTEEDVTFNSEDFGESYTARFEDDGWSFALSDDYQNGDLLSEDDQLVLATARYLAVADSDGETTEIAFCDGFGDDVLAATYCLSGGKLLAPTVVDLQIEIRTPLFKRGDADGDGEVTVLLDALYLLNYAHGNGLRPPCFAAADCDGDGTIFSLLDAIYLITYGFLDGEEPPDPGTDECGLDPEADGLGCSQPPDCL